MEAVIIEAIVKIKLNMDGSWQLLELKEAFKPILEPETPPKTATEYLLNAEKLRKKRKKEKNRIPHHCSICGKAYTNRRNCPHHT